MNAIGSCFRALSLLAVAAAAAVGAVPNYNAFNLCSSLFPDKQLRIDVE